MKDYTAEIEHPAEASYREEAEAMRDHWEAEAAAEIRAELMNGWIIDGCDPADAWAFASSVMAARERNLEAIAAAGRSEYALWR